MVVNMAPERLLAIARLLFDEMEDFCRALRANGNSEAGYFADCLAEARQCCSWTV